MNPPVLHLDQDSAFRPIEFEPSQLDDSLHECLESPTGIFRDVAPMDVSMPSVRRANPIQEQSSAMDTDNMNMRVISPYPFSTSQEEIEEREQLTTVEWSIEEKRDAEPGPAVQIDFSRFFDMSTLHNNTSEMHCDEFTLSSHEANSLTQEDICLDSISDDPAAFWEEGIERVATDRSFSPAAISVGSSQRQSPIDPDLAEIAIPAWEAGQSN